ncbi:peptidylprolyl isomerase [Thermodesulfobacteriota bacterium]
MRFLLILGMITFAVASTANAAEDSSVSPKVLLETSKGKIIVELYPEKAPVTVQNFLAYVASGFYDGSIFHRVIHRFMIQGGGFTAEMKRKETMPPITNEADNGLKNGRGTICMARTSEPHSATSQFFINTVDNKALNHKGKNTRGWGYAVFGRVIEGMDVVDAISMVKKGRQGSFRDVPVEPVVILKSSKIKESHTKSK